MSRARQTRSTAGGVEYRAVPLGETSADGGKLSGVAIRFNSPTQIGDPTWGFREQFAPGAFTNWLQTRDVVLLDNHDQAKPIARMSAGTLRANQTGDGLRWDADPVDTQYAHDAQANIKAGNYGGCSVGFRAVQEDWLDDDGNPSNPLVGTQRIVREAELPEFSVVTFPAYGDTEVSARDLVTAAREARTAKATYSDLETCGECGSTGQYGAYCGNCGEPMGQSAPSGNFCTDCGAELTGNRSDHTCTEVRGKYTAAQKKDMLDKGHAIANANGDPSYPIEDEEDLDNAIQAVGRGTADHDDIRKHIIDRAKALGLSAKIPDNWNADGSLNDQDDDGSRSADPKPEASTSDVAKRSLRLRELKLSEMER